MIRIDDVAAWRRDERIAQLDARRAMPLADRTAVAEAIAERLWHAIEPVAGKCISLYWPIKAEPDLRPLFERIMTGGGTGALPVVVERGQPLVFRAWAPGEPLQRGFWNIPVPAAGRELVPDVSIAPLVAFDRACFRLGYGGGYFDRTLAALAGRTRVLGVGLARAEIATIHPLAHDVPMDAIVTEAELIVRQPATRSGGGKV